MGDVPALALNERPLMNPGLSQEGITVSQLIRSTGSFCA